MDENNSPKAKNPAKSWLIVVSIIAGVMLIAWIVTFFYQARQISNLKTDKQNLQNQLGQTNEEQANLEDVQKSYNALKIKYDNVKKYTDLESFIIGILQSTGGTALTDAQKAAIRTKILTINDPTILAAWDGAMGSSKTDTQKLIDVFVAISNQIAKAQK